jgi:glycosyltransferase involved in cell wall biosynthesis
MNKPCTLNAEMVKVSIGMPVYNGAKYLREAIDSILAQAFGDFELIISDNGSEDDTEAICRQCAERDRRIRYIRQSENKGASWNFRHVLNLSRGEYFMWAADDDWRYPSFLNDAVFHFQESHDLVCIQGTVDFIANEKVVVVLDSDKKFFKSKFLSFFLSREPYGKCMLMYGLFRRKALLEADWPQLDDDGNWCWNDALFLFSILKFGGVGFVRKPGMGYRLKITKQEQEEKSVLEAKRPFVMKVLSANPVSYYLKYCRVLPFPGRAVVFMLIPFKMLKANMESYMVYCYNRFFLKSVHGRKLNTRPTRVGL